MKIVNQIEKKSMAERDRVWKLHKGEVTSLHRHDKTLGGILILTRILGHPEFEPVYKPLFNKKHIIRASEQLDEE